MNSSTSSRNDGGPAFPSADSTHMTMGPHGQPVAAYVLSGGMSLRDWFAGQVLPNIAQTLMVADPGALSRAITKSGLTGDVTVEQFVAVLAYRYADAMLAARESSS